MPDILIIGWDLENNNTLEVIKKLKKEKKTSDIPVIIISENRSNPEHIAQALNQGALYFIRKPFDKLEFQARIKSALRLTELYQKVKTAEKELSIQRNKLEDLYREQNDLMSIVAHDLKSPLNKVLGLIQLMPMVGGLNGEQASYVGMIQKVIEGGRKLIDDILIINPAESHSEPLSIEEINLDEFITELLYTHRQTAKEKNIILHFNQKSGALFQSDRECLQRILDNLLSNAIKFSYNDKNVFVEAKKLNNGIQITVRDEGQGISKEDQKKMFKKFQKLSARPTAGESSTGLGLSIIKALVGKLEGSIDFESEVDKGTVFYVKLPSLTSS